MIDADTAREQDSLVGLAFPVIRVRYLGPTDHRPSRYVATLRGVRVTESYDHALDGGRNAYNAAAERWKRYRFRYSDAFEGDDQPRVFIPGDLTDDSYSFTVVPTAFLSDAPEPNDAPEETAAVTRTDYPGAPLPGDRFGWVVAAANGAHMTEPYRDRSRADDLRGSFAPDAHLVHVTLEWPTP
jgi:hypothetical protein